MADLTNDAPLRHRYPTLLMTERFTLDNSVAQTVYRGNPMILDASVDTLNAVVFDSTVTLATGDAFLGIATHGATVLTTDTEADNEVEIITSGEVGFQSSVFTDADIGKAIYADDSAVLTLTSTANLLIGYLKRVVDGYAYVAINGDTNAATIAP